MTLVGATLLVDGIYLAWVTFATGGVQSPVRFLVYVHVVAVTLLSSYRTGIKIAAWYSLLLFVAFYAQRAGILGVRAVTIAGLPEGANFNLVLMLNVAALWMVALGTATFSAVNERDLRAQKIDLERLAAMTVEIEQRQSASDIPVILLDDLCEVFAFTRGAVLASPQDDLILMAYRGGEDTREVQAGLDPLMERAWKSRETQLVRELDSEIDPRLAMLFPGGRNLLIVPLFLDRGLRLGILVVETTGARNYIKRWVVTMVEQFAAHAALALHNAWLLDEIQEKLEENRKLGEELLAQNFALEGKVQDRTQELSQSLESLRILDAQRGDLLSRLVNAEEEERRRIANDIHDGPIQRMVGAGLQLEMVRRRLSGVAQDAVLTQIDEVRGSLSVSLEGMRTLVFELRPATLDERGLAAALDEFLRGLDPELKFKIDARLRSEPPAETRIILYRIAQEALTNVRKHAKATKVEVLLEEQDAGYLVRVHDNGVGFNSAERKPVRGHVGLSSMRERAEMAGGKCEVISRAGDGTSVEIWVPSEPTAPPSSGLDRVSADESATSLPWGRVSADSALGWAATDSA
jgi:signal transduction histidine kinase